MFQLRHGFTVALALVQGCATCPPELEQEELVWQDATMSEASTIELVVDSVCGQALELEVSGDSNFSIELPKVRLKAGETSRIPVAFFAEDYAVHEGALELRSELLELEIPLEGWVDPDADDDGHLAVGAGGDDCDDNRADVHPGALGPPCDGFDYDCDGVVEVALTDTARYPDLHTALSDTEGVVQVCPGTHATNIVARDREVRIAAWTPTDGSPQEPAVLSGEGAHRIIDMNGGHLYLEGVTLRDGLGDGNGGAIRLVGTHLYTLGLTFVDNSATGTGGALYAGLDGEKTSYLYGAMFLDNSATEGAGAIDLVTGNLSIQDGRINGNSAPDGAVHVAAGTFFASFRTHWGSDDSANTRHDVVCEEGRWPYDFDGGPHDFWCDGSVCR